MQRSPAAFPLGMPGIGDEMEGAVQHAPHAGRHWKGFIRAVLLMVRLIAVVIDCHIALLVMIFKQFKQCRFVPLFKMNTGFVSMQAKEWI
jgi:hypothetical protein